jgi:hypothetical protein
LRSEVASADAFLPKLDGLFRFLLEPETTTAAAS